MYPDDAAERHEQLQEYRRDAICAMERKVSAITEDRLKRHPREILKYLENPEDVRSRHIKWIRQQQKIKHEMRERRRHAWVPESYVAGRSNGDINHVMPADELIASKQPPSLTKRELINYWSKHHLESMAGQQKLQKLKRDLDPNPKAIDDPSGQTAMLTFPAKSRGRQKARCWWESGQLHGTCWISITFLTHGTVYNECCAVFQLHASSNT